MAIINGYSGCKREDIMSMSKKELQEAIIRVFSLPEREFDYGDSWVGTFLLPDDIADAFRGREPDMQPDYDAGNTKKIRLLRKILRMIGRRGKL